MITTTNTPTGELESLTISDGRQARTYTAAELLEALVKKDHRTIRQQAIPSASMPAILTRAAELFDTPIIAITGASRQQRVSAVRFAVMHAARRAGHTLDAIGEALGGRDHSTVMSGDERAQEIARTDTRYADRLAKLGRVRE